MESLKNRGAEALAGQNATTLARSVIFRDSLTDYGSGYDDLHFGSNSQCIDFIFTSGRLFLSLAHCANLIIIGLWGARPTVDTVRSFGI